MKKLLAIILTLSILAGIGIVGVFADSTEQGYIVSPSEGDMEEILANLGEGGAVIGYVGDTDLSNNITVKDATAIQKHLASLVILTDAPLLLADTDRSGGVTIKDATAIQKWVAGMAVDAPVFHTLYKEGKDVVVTPATLDEAVLGNWKEQTDLADELNAKITNPFDARADRENHRLFSLMVKLDSFSATKEYLFKEDLTYLVAHSDVKTYADTVAELEEDLTKFIFTVTGATSVVDKKFGVILNALGVESVEELAQMLLTLREFNAVISDKSGTFFASEGTFTFDETTAYSYEIAGDVMTFSDAEGNVTNILNRVRVLDSAVPGNWKEQTDLAGELNAKITNPFDARADREIHRLFSLMVKLDSFSATKEYLFKEDLTYLVAHSDVKTYDDTVAELEEDLTEFIFAVTGATSVVDKKFDVILNALDVESVEELAATIFTQQSYNSVLIFKTGTFFASEGVFTLDDTTYTYEIIGDTMTLTDAQGDIAKVLKKPKTIDSAIIGQWSAAVDLASKINNKIVSPVDDTKEKIKFKDYVSIESCPATMIYTFNDDGTFSITYPQRATYSSVVTELEEDLTAFLLAATGAISAEDRKFVVMLNALGYESVSDFAAVLFTQAMYNEITAPSEGTYFAAEGTLVLNDKVTVAYTINNQILTITPEKEAFIRLQKLLDLDNGK